eukprot:Rmarinus@m.17623
MTFNHPFNFNSQLEDAFNDLVKQLETQQKTIGEMQKQMETFATKDEMIALQEKLEGDISRTRADLENQIKTGLGELDLKVQSAMEASQKATEKKFAAVDTTLEGHGKRLGDLERLTEKHGERLATAEDTLVEKAQRVDMDAAMARLEEADKATLAELQTLQGVLATKAANTEFAALDGRVERRLGEITHKTESTLYDLGSRVQAALDAVEAIRGDHSTLSNRTTKCEEALGQQDEKIDEGNTRVSSLENTLETKASSDEMRNALEDVMNEIGRSITQRLITLEKDQPRQDDEIEKARQNIKKVEDFINSALKIGDSIDIIEFQKSVMERLENKADKTDVALKAEIEDFSRMITDRVDRIGDRVEKTELLDTAALEQLVANCNLLNTHLQTKADHKVVEQLQLGLGRLELILNDASEMCLVCKRREPVVGVRSLIKQRTQPLPGEVGVYASLTGSGTACQHSKSAMGGGPAPNPSREAYYSGGSLTVRAGDAGPGRMGSFPQRPLSSNAMKYR